MKVANLARAAWSKRRLIVVVGAVLGLIWYWKSFITYDGEVSRFERRIRREVNLVALQSWATNLLRTYSVSNTTDPIHLRKSDFPADILNLNRGFTPSLFGQPPLSGGSVYPDASEEIARVRIMWGAGMRGHWSLDVGFTNLILSSGEMLKPGIFFWREFKK